MTMEEDACAQEHDMCRGRCEDVDCSVTEWTEWSACSAECGGGEQTRDRSVIIDAVGGGAACPSLQETQSCNTQDCESTCENGNTPFDITIHVNMRSEEVSADGVFIAGGGHLGGPGDNQMSDDDGDGVFSFSTTICTLPDSEDQLHFTILNGNCGDWSCKEDIGGQSCVANEYNDRGVYRHQPESSIVFGDCDGLCIGGVAPGSEEVTFNVDMRDEEVSDSGVFIAGGEHFGLSPDDWHQMSDSDGDGVYTLSVDVDFGRSCQTAFTILNGNHPWWTGKEDISGQSCAWLPHNDRMIRPGEGTYDLVYGQC